MNGKKVPIYINTWMFVAAVLIFWCITGSIQLTMGVKNAPEVITNMVQNEDLRSKLQKMSHEEAGIFIEEVIEGEIDSKLHISGSAGPKEMGMAPANEHFERKMFFWSILIILLGTLFNFPFRIYFRRARKGKTIPEGIVRYCKRFLRKTPIINAAIFGLPITILLINMVMAIGKGNSTFSDSMDMSILKNLFIVSLASCLLVGLFIYCWQKFRVDNKYLEVVHTPEELNSRPMNFKVDRIAKRLWLSSIMTTVLPIAIIIFYFGISISTIGDLGTRSEAEVQLFFGDYLKISDAVFGGRETTMAYYYLEGADILGDKLWYINAVDTWIVILGIGMGMLVALLYVAFFIRWTTESITFPLKKLLHSMDRMARGELGVVTSVRNNDEMGELAEGFNHMSRKLDHHVNHIQTLNDSYFRFVPRQFIEYLGKDDISQVSLGDQIQGHMTVVFTDIRDFTTLSETMSPEENFNFINKYLGAMEPAIIKNNGFIDKYIGDSIMAIFGGSPADAIQAALDMKRNLQELNKERIEQGLASIRMGIGIHAGHVMLGLVGGKSRIDGTVISDAVNLSSRIEGLTKLYEVSILVSQRSFEELEDREKQRFNYRVLDRVQVKGKNETVTVLEILDPDDPKDKLKLEYKDFFAQAMERLCGGEYDAVCAELEELAEKYPEDQVIAIYLDRVRQLKKNGAAEGWEGVTVITRK